VYGNTFDTLWCVRGQETCWMIVSATSRPANCLYLIASYLLHITRDLSLRVQEETLRYLVLQNLFQVQTLLLWKYNLFKNSITSYLLVNLSRCRHASSERKTKYTSSFLTSTLDRMGGQLHAPVALCPRERTPGTHWVEAVLTSELVWTQRLEEKSLPLPGIEPRSSSL
jgi:hypothetical protein